MKPLYKVLLLLLLITGISCQGLKKDEIAKIQFELYGDFGSEQSQLTLFTADGYSKARLETKGTDKVEVRVDESGLNAFNVFITELKGVGTESYCTTDQYCTVYTRNEKIVKKHIDCSWQGFAKLKEALFDLQK
jgi:hypothetical protein